MISSTSLLDSPASFNAVLQGSIERFSRSATSDSSFDLVILILRCLGPDASAVIYGRLTSVCSDDESSIFAFSAASFNL